MVSFHYYQEERIQGWVSFIFTYFKNILFFQIKSMEFYVLKSFNIGMRRGLLAYPFRSLALFLKFQKACP